MATPEPEEINIADYTSTAVLEIDQSAQTLSHDPKILTETSAKAHRSNGGAVIAEVSGIAHGTYSGRSATFISFVVKFPYESPQSWHRITEATIEVSFRPASAGEPWPSIIEFAPEYIHGPSQDAAVRIKNTIGLSAGAPDLVPLALDLSVEREKETEFSQTHATTMGGSASISRSAFQAGSDGEDVVTWRLAENTLQNDGIPTVVKTAVLLESPADSFHLLVNVRADTAGKLLFRGWPWTRRRPLVVRKSVSFGPTAGTTVFGTSEFGIESWQPVVGWNRPYESIKHCRNTSQDEA